MGKRKVFQIAFELELDRRSGAGQHGITQVFAGLLEHDSGQVALHPGQLDAAKKPLHIEHSRPRRARHMRPTALQDALRIGSVDTQVAGADAVARGLLAPLHLGGQFLDGYARVGPARTQVDQAAGHGHFGTAFAFTQVKLHIQALKARAAVSLGRQAQTLYLAFGGVGIGLACGAFPAGAEFLHQTGRRIGLQHVARFGCQRQALGHLAQGGQVQALGAQFTMGGNALGMRISGGAPVPQRQAGVAAGPTHAIGGLELQIAGGVLHAAVELARSQPARGRRQYHGCLLSALAQKHIAEQDIGGGASDPAWGDIEPCAHAAPAPADVGPSVQVDAQRAPVHMAEKRVSLPFPVLPAARVAAEQRVAEHALHIEALAPVRWRAGVQAQAVAQVAAAQDQVHIVQFEHRHVTGFVGPAHAAVADGHLGLAHQPIGAVAGATVGLADFQAGNPKTAIGSAANIQRGAVNIELLQTTGPQRARRNGCAHRTQLQGHTALAVNQLHIAQLDRRN